MNLEISFWPDSEPARYFETAVRGWFDEYGAGSFHFPKLHFSREKSFSWTVPLKDDDVLMAIHALHQKLYLLGVSFEVKLNDLEINCEISTLPPRAGSEPARLRRGAGGDLTPSGKP